jgi:hypothetical protein
MAIGDHLTVDHGLYTHHGIEVDDGFVIHYGRGLSDIKNAKIEIVSREIFADGKPIKLVKSPCIFSGPEVIERAKSRLGENCYDVFDNNCEHFANWCRSDDALSPQAQTTKTLLRQTAAIASRPLVAKTMQKVALRRAIAAPLIVADLVQTGVEIAATRSGKSHEHSERLGSRAGAATSMGIGLVAGGPIGAASGLGLWMAGQVFAKAALRSGQNLLNPRSADDTDTE